MSQTNAIGWSLCPEYLITCAQRIEGLSDIQLLQELAGQISRLKASSNDICTAFRNVVRITLARTHTHTHTRINIDVGVNE